MSKFSSPRLAAAGIAALAFIAACSTEGPTKDIAGPRGPTFGIGEAAAKKVEVCLDPTSAAGTYNFALSGFISGMTGDTPNPVNPSSLTVGIGPTCFDALIRTSSNTDSPSPLSSITVTASKAVAAAGTFSFTCVAANATDPSQFCSPVSGANVATGRMNSFHGATITFKFVADPLVVDDGCTYTQGWWKHKGKAIAALYDFDGGTDNGLSVLNTPPKGNVYYVLAHQYIAATLNIANGATISGDAQTAYNAATAYFIAADPGSPLPGSYTKASVTALANTLDQWNNGIIGPGDRKSVV